ncbi:hypothetical protein [Aquimarina longa]|uniref:hypothetical protein n=1 Tax=Aquimarina longa TaxID=1080221 RepID=UPI0007857A5D|nr:hypothetical protein [Aquimarina longa]
MKKIVVALIIFIAISCDDVSKKPSSLIDHIPRDAQVIIKINDLEGATSKLRDNNFIKNNKHIAFINYLKNLSILDKTNQTESLLCFSPLGKNSFEYTYISKFNPAIINNDSLNTKTIETINYSNQIIYKISSKEDSFFATHQDSLLIASSSQLLIENAVRLKTNLTPVDRDLKKAYEVSGTKNALSVLFNGKKLQHIQNSLVPNTTLESLHNFSGWVSTDATIEQNAMYLDGIAIEKDSLSSTIGIFDNTVPKENLIPKITPVSAKGFISYTYDNYKILKKNLSIAQDREVNDIPEDLDPMLSYASEIGLIFLEKEDVLVINSIDIETTKEDLSKNKKVETYRNSTIYTYDNPSAFSQTLNPLVKNFDAKFYFIIDNFIVFGSSTNALKDVIANIMNLSVLYDQEYYKATMKKLASESSILIVGAIKNVKEYISENTTKNYSSQWNTLKYKGYQIGVIQIIKENDFAHIHGVLQKNKAKGAATSVSQTASTTLEHGIINKPILVKNHRTKGMDIAVQDVENNLYLISDKGAIFWKKQIDGEILGEIKQVDIYKNGRYQLLFTTANTLYLLDRDGKDVKPYPKTFEKPITQPLALFDYDKSKRYRIIITQGNKVTMLDIKTKNVTGFRFKGTETPLNLPPKHIRIGTKDYIVITEENGELTILDRLGKTRINVKEKVRFSKNEWYQYLNKITSTTKDGKLIQIQKDGKAVTQNLNLHEDHKIVATNKTLVSLSENKLSIKGRVVELDYGMYTEPKLYYINNKIYVTITDMQSKKVYLYDSNAELFPHFPVYGNSVLSLGNMDKDPNLEFVVQGEENSVLIYQIN